MKEYIVFYENTFFRLGINKLGLYVQKPENNRFSEKEFLLFGAREDFCAMADNLIYVVCQGETGEIIYLVFDGKTWQKTVLLESKEGRAYKKYFELVKLGNLINLFYTIKHDEKYLLIHQILDGTYSQPEVVDFVMPCGVRFCISEHTETDISIIYKNQNGVCGSKVYRWSKKSFLPFVPFKEDVGLEPYAVKEKDGATHMLGCCDRGGKRVVTYYLKNELGKTLKHELAFADEKSYPVLFMCKGKIIVQWQDGGMVAAAVSEDGGESFSKPVKYIKNAYSDILLFALCGPQEKCFCYGLNSGNNIAFYSEKDILSEIRSDKKKIKSVLNGSEAMEFAVRAGYKKTNGWEDDPYVTQKELKGEIEKLKKAIDEFKEKMIKNGDENDADGG